MREVKGKTHAHRHTQNDGAPSLRAPLLSILQVYWSPQHQNLPT